MLILILAGLLLYFNSLTNGFVGDDIDQIVRNTNVHSLKNIKDFFSGSTYYGGGKEKLTGVYYRPVMTTIYSLIYTLFGPRPFFFHLFQIFIHTANAILVFLILGFFLKKEVAFIASLIFLVHPINSETVLYIANLQEVLFIFFGMLAFLVFKRQKLNIKAAIIVFFLLLSSVLSKESGFLFAILLIFYSRLFKRSKFKLSLIQFLLVGVIYSILRLGVARIFLSQVSIAPIAKASLSQRMLNIPYVILFYLKTFLFPKDLQSVHSEIINKVTISNFYLPLIVSLLFFLSLILAGFWLKNKRQKLLNPYLFFLIWFISGLATHLNFFPLDMTVAERWFYFPIIGLLGMGGIIIQAFKFNNRLAKIVAVSFFSIAITILALRTFIRNFNWRDSFTLNYHDAKVAKGDFILENAVGTELIQQAKYQDAKPHIISSVNAYPFFANLNNLAIIYLSEGKVKKAKDYLEKALKLSSTYLVFENYANFLLYYDEPKTAQDFTAKALKIYSLNAKLWIILAESSYKLGNYKKAEKEAAKAYGLNRNERYLEIYLKIKNKTLQFDKKG